MLRDMKLALVDRRGNRLLASLQAVLGAVGDYYRRLAASTASLGITAEMLPSEVVDEPIPDDAGLPGHGARI